MAEDTPSPDVATNYAGAGRPWHGGWKVVASLLLAFHLAAMVVASYCSTQASPLAYKVYEVCGPYAQLMYVNHGYRFFSPEPGSSTLIEFQSLLQDGTQRSETIPNHGEGGQWPRVFYHRHFMLTEFLSAVSEQPQLFNKVVESYAAHYLSRHPEVAEVTLVQVIHLLPTPEFIQAGGDLLHESTYVRETLGTFRWNPETSNAVRVDAEMAAPSVDNVPAPLPAVGVHSSSETQRDAVPHMGS